MKGDVHVLLASDLVEQLGVPHRKRAAVRALLGMGFRGVPAALQGLGHRNDLVRRGCAEFFDHYMVPEALPGLIRLLDDPHPRVRLLALHALACDRCKEGDCRPDEKDVLPKAVEILQTDPSPHTRAMAIEVIGNYVHTSKAAEEALIRAKLGDRSPAVRKKAGRYAPGGTIHKRTATKRSDHR